MIKQTYELLQVGEIIKEGDEMYPAEYNEWITVKSELHGEKVVKSHVPMRRKVIEPDYTSKEYQDQFRLKWAADPTIEREFRKPCGLGEWILNEGENWYANLIYRPRQQPKEKSIEELTEEAADKYAGNYSSCHMKKAAFLAGAAYARRAKKVSK